MCKDIFATLDLNVSVLGRATAGEAVVVRGGDGVALPEHPHCAAQDVGGDQLPHPVPPRQPRVPPRRSSLCSTTPRAPASPSPCPFDLAERVAAPFVHTARPRVAILREQGVNGQVEMAAAFDRAGFAAVDVTMSDLLAGRAHLRDFSGLAACGGFSYGDVLGAGSGWAKTILFNEQLKEMFRSSSIARTPSHSASATAAR